MDHAIEADVGSDSHSIADSGYDDTLCSSDSLRSSVFAYEQINGRTYHAFHAGKYHVPNDEGEQERMDIHYHALRLSIEDKIFHAPVKDPAGILDVGAGTGIWAMDAADSYPAAQVVGFDLSPIQPTTVPPNLIFEVLDADESWDYGTERFDLVHTRFMNGFSIKSWDHFYREAYMSLKPGGWVENQEFDCQVLSDDGTIPPNSYVQEWVRLWNDGMQMVGMTGRCDPEALAQQMRNAGFINVHIKMYKMPIGPWPKDPMLKEAGVYGLVAIVDGMQGLSMKIFTKILGWSVEKLEVFLTAVRSEFKRRSIHSYWPCFVIMGQKPPELPTESNTSFEATQPDEAAEDLMQMDHDTPSGQSVPNEANASIAPAAPTSPVTQSPVHGDSTPTVTAALTAPETMTRPTMTSSSTQTDPISLQELAQPGALPAATAVSPPAASQAQAVSQGPAPAQAPAMEENSTQRIPSHQPTE